MEPAVRNTRCPFRQQRAGVVRHSVRLAAEGGVVGVGPVGGHHAVERQAADGGGCGREEHEGEEEEEEEEGEERSTHCEGVDAATAAASSCLQSDRGPGHGGQLFFFTHHERDRAAAVSVTTNTEAGGVEQQRVRPQPQIGPQYPDL